MAEGKFPLTLQDLEEADEISDRLLGTLTPVRRIDPSSEARMRSFTLLYGVFRFIVEFVRVPDQQLDYLAFGWVTMGQVLSLPLIAIGLYLFWLSRRSPVLQPLPAKG